MSATHASKATEGIGMQRLSLLSQDGAALSHQESRANGLQADWSNYEQQHQSIHLPSPQSPYHIAAVVGGAVRGTESERSRQTLADMGFGTQQETVSEQFAQPIQQRQWIGKDLVKLAHRSDMCREKRIEMQKEQAAGYIH